MAEPRQAAEARAPRIRKGEEGLGSKVFIMAQGKGEDARVPLHVQLGSPEELHLGFFKLALQLLQAEGGLGPTQKVLGAGARKAHGRAAEVATHLLQRRWHHEVLLHRRTTGSEEQAGRPPRRRLTSSPGSRDPAALAFDVAMEVVGAGEALVAELALVGPDARVDAHVVLQVVVVHEFGVAVDAEVRPLPRVLPHVDFELVLPAKEKALGQAAWAGRDAVGIAPWIRRGKGDGKMGSSSQGFQPQRCPNVWMLLQDDICIHLLLPGATAPKHRTDPALRVRSLKPIPTSSKQPKLEKKNKPSGTNPQTIWEYVNKYTSIPAGK